MSGFDIQYASWDQLPAEFREGLGSMIDGTPEEAHEFYRLYFYWFFVPHEMGHLLRQHFGTDGYRHGSYWSEEQDVNDFAVAYWRHLGCDRRLDEVGAFAKRALAVLPDPVPAGTEPQAFLDANFETVVAQPQVYGYFQFSMIAESLEKTLDFVPTIRRCIWEDAVDAGATPDLDYPRIHEDLPREIVADLVPVLEQHAIDVPPVGVIKEFAPHLSFVVRRDESGPPEP